MMKFDPKIHHRSSIRLKGYDYTQTGAYFITIVTYHREPLFGEIMNGGMQLSDMGRIADEHWRAIPEHFPHAELGAYVIMPNHVHGIIIITDGRGTIYCAPTEQFQKPVKGSIPTIIRTYKASVTRRIQREVNSTGIWQKNFYEHVIRDDEDHNRIHLYIEANVDNWGNDEENPVNVK
jgi:REP element-mobilizing transposase RayT